MSAVRQSSLLGVTMLSTIGFCWIAHWAWNQSAVFLANTWRNALEQAPEREVEGLVERISQLGDEAVPALVDVLQSQRESASRAAAKAICRQLKQWESLPARIRASRRRQLAMGLVEAWPRLQGPSRLVAAELLRELVSAGISDAAREDAPLLAACAEVLRSLTPRQAESLNDQLLSRITAQMRNQTSGASFGQSLQTPPGVHALDCPRRAEGLVADTETVRPAPLPQGGALPSPLPAMGSAVNAVEEKAPEQSTPRGATANEPRLLSGVRQASVEGPIVPGSMTRDSPEPAEVAHLVTELNEQDPQRQAAACQRLADLGWSATEIQIFKQLRHSDAAVRQALVRSLPDVAGLDAAPWLVELSRDPDPDVRLEAMTLLATTGDPALLETVRKLAAADPDERIQKLSARLAQAKASRVKEPSQ